VFAKRFASLRKKSVSYVTGKTHVCTCNAGQVLTVVHTFTNAFVLKRTIRITVRCGDKTRGRKRIIDEKPFTEGTKFEPPAR
jgi:hypothetical protein